MYVRIYTQSYIYVNIYIQAYTNQHVGNSKACVRVRERVCAFVDSQVNAEYARE